VAIASLVGLTACTTYVDRRPPPPVVYSPPPPVYSAPAPQPVYVEPASDEVVIRDERDFYEPLSPYGRWEYIGNYGRCWIPAHVESDWRPYSNGHWERTDDGWYWMSDEPWGWATYHYGRWDFEQRVGWFWVPQTMWAPAWVTWHHGGGYIGWSPLPPSARIAPSGVIEVNTRAIPQRSYVFVEERRFLEPIRPARVVNNTTIINNTVNITNIKVVNNTVINEGPATQEIEQTSGRKLRPGCGTLDYCSPEVLGTVPTDYVPSPMPADIYAFACMAYEALTAELLFEAEDEARILSLHVAHDGWPDRLAENACSRSRVYTPPLDPCFGESRCRSRRV